MTDEGGAGRRRGLFRRNRSGDDLIDRDPLEGTLPELPPPDPEEVALWDQTAAPRPRVPKRTADMFAPKEQFSDTWSEDAWDDEWKEPAVRRTSIPPAADPTPQKVDEWLESGAEDFNDVTRDSVRKLGVDPSLAAARAIRPGSTWDDTGDVSTADSAASIDPALIDTALIDTALIDPALQATIERALATPPVAAATPPAAPIENNRGAGVSKRFGRARSSIELSDADAGSAGSDSSHEDVVDISTGSVSVRNASVDSPVDTAEAITADAITADAITTTETPDDLAALETLATSESTDSALATLDELPDREWDRPVFAPTEPKPPTEPTPPTEAKQPSEQTQDAARVVADPPSDGATELKTQPAPEPQPSTRSTRVDNSDVDNSDVDTSDEDGFDEDGSTDTPHDFNEEIEMDSVRAHAFTDRASWIGTGLGGIAAARLALHVASNMKQADPVDTPIGALARIGGGFANAGVMHGLLLIAAVTLLSLPALFNRADFVPRRTGAGLGLVLGAALVGLLGGAVALFTQTSLADAIGSKVTLGSTGEILAALALSAVALGATMRALRSFAD